MSRPEDGPRRLRVWLTPEATRTVLAEVDRRKAQGDEVSIGGVVNELVLAPQPGDAPVESPS